MYCCAHAMAVNASAVASTPVISTALPLPPSRETAPARRANDTIPSNAAVTTCISGNGLKADHGRVVTDYHDMQRENHRAQQTEQVSPAHAESSRRSVINAIPNEAIKIPATSDGSRPVSVDERTRQRYHRNRQTRQKGRLRGRGQLQAHRLEDVSYEQKATRRDPRHASFPADSAPALVSKGDSYQRQRRHAETQREKQNRAKYPSAPT